MVHWCFIGVRSRGFSRAMPPISCGKFSLRRSSRSIDLILGRDTRFTVGFGRSPQQDARPLAQLLPSTSIEIGCWNVPTTESLSHTQFKFLWFVLFLLEIQSVTRLKKELHFPKGKDVRIHRSLNRRVELCDS